MDPFTKPDPRDLLRRLESRRVSNEEPTKREHTTWREKAAHDAMEAEQGTALFLSGY